MARSRPTSAAKVLTPAQAARWVRARQAKGSKVVFTNGCFDLLHRGHVTYLEEARNLGGALLVALNSDASVRRLKGEDRPLVPLRDRARVVAALGSVDAVTWFTSDTPVPLLRKLKPLIYVKGGDWDVTKIPEAAVVRAYGGRLKRLRFVEGRSTTKLIEKARKEK